MSPSAGGFSETPGQGPLLPRARAEPRRAGSFRPYGGLGRGNVADPRNLGKTAPVPCAKPFRAHRPGRALRHPLPSGRRRGQQNSPEITKLKTGKKSLPPSSLCPPPPPYSCQAGLIFMIAFE